MTNAIKANMSSLTRRLDKILAPLNKREEKLAIESAVALLTADREIREDARCRVLGAELAIERTAKIGALPKRRIRVLITDYSATRNLEYLVEAGKVVESRTLSFQPAFHRDEIIEARQLADRDARLASLIKRRGSLVVSAASPEKASKGRLVALRYALAPKGKPASFLATAVVDLSRGKVVSVAEGGPVKGEGGVHG